MKLSSLKEEKFIVLIKETKNVDEINNFFMNNFLEQSRDLPEVHEKSLNEMKELNRLQGSPFDTIARRKFSKIEILSLNSQARYRNYKMKLIV